jgi:hypothetical protein
MSEEVSSFGSLLGDSDLDVAEYAKKQHLRRSSATERLQYALLAAFGLSLGLNLVFSFTFFKEPRKQLQHDTMIPQRLYCRADEGNSFEVILTIVTAPAQDAVSYKLTKFESGIYGGETPYQGPPSGKNNRLWQELYARKLIRPPYYYKLIVYKMRSYI